MSAAPSSPAIHSMTGYCLVEHDGPGGRFRVEAKSLNHRFLDLKLRLPRDLASLESSSRAWLQTKLSRGSVEIRVDFEPLDETPAEVPEIHLPLAAHYFEAIKKLQQMVGLQDSVRAIELMTLPDVIRRKNESSPEPDLTSRKATLEAALERGISRLLEMRKHEGAALTRALTQAIGEIRDTTKKLSGMRNQLVEREKARVARRMTEIFEAHPLPESAGAAVLDTRVAQEVALLIERSDVQEELTRLSGHCEHFLKILSDGGPVGKKLEFLLQELHREINTLGSKSQDLEIASEVIELKVKLEQIREQVMNLE